MFWFLLFLQLGWSAEWKSPFNTPIGVQEFRKKAESKQGSRWTLKDWLSQKERNQMMDLWLGMYSPAPYELFLGGSYQNYDIEPQKNYSNTKAHIGFYALILGLEYIYEDNPNDRAINQSSSIHLRILGNANQGTHFNIGYGVRATRTGISTISQRFADAELEIYVERNSGLHGSYRNYFAVDDSILAGRRWQGGLFFDLGPLRLFAHYFADLAATSTSGAITTVEKKGVESGLTLHF